MDWQGLERGLDFHSNHFCEEEAFSTTPDMFHDVNREECVFAQSFQRKLNLPVWPTAGMAQTGRLTHRSGIFRICTIPVG